jgi:hypothetical protein
MLRIRPEQMLAFEQAADDKFTGDIIGHLLRFHPAAVSHIPAADLRAQVNQRKARAREYGFTGQAAITGFIALTFNIGPRFDLHPAIQAVLTDVAVSPDDRVQQLRFRVQPLDWAEATRL